MTERTMKALGDQLIAGLDREYDLIYVAHDDKLTDKQVAAITRGDSEALWESTWEWESDCRYQSAKEIIERDAKDIVREWESENDEDYDDLVDAFEGTDEWDRVRYEIDDRDSGQWMRDLINATPRVLLRISVLDEDHAYSFEDVSPARVLHDVGLPITDGNVKVMDATLAECSPEFSVLLGYWIVGADVGQLYDLPADDDAEVEIVNPHLYLGNPFAGSGFISENAFTGTVRVRREDLRTDKDAFGYAVTEVYGGLRASDFEAEIRIATKEGSTR